MTEEQLYELLTKESATVEWKAVGDPEKIVKTLAAFANDFEGLGRGVVLCGIEERHDAGLIVPVVKGITVSEAKRLQDRIFEIIRARVEPYLYPRFEMVSFSADRSVLAIWIDPGEEVHFFQRMPVIRLGDKVTTANAKQHTTLTERKYRQDWLAQPCPDSTVDDIDFFAMEELAKGLRPAGGPAELLRPDVRMFGAAQPLTARMPTPFGDAVTLNRFALLLAGKEPHRFLPGATVKLTRFGGNTRSEAVFSSEEFLGPIPLLIRNIMGALEPDVVILTDKTRTVSQNRIRYSRQALHEVLVNALCHRDYRDPSAVRIAVFQDRIEFESPGGLQDSGGIKAIKEGRTRWRNPSLARFLVHLGLAQEAGSGIPRVIEETRKVAGLEPVFEVGDWFKVTVPAYGRIERPVVLAGDGEEAGLMVVSIGFGQIEPVLIRRSHPWFEQTTDAQFAEASFRHPVLKSEEEWRNAALKVRNWARSRLEDSRFKEFHLFYRGPVPMGPLIGALAVGRKPVVVYYFDEETSVYREVYRLDRKLLQGE